MTRRHPAVITPSDAVTLASTAAYADGDLMADDTTAASVTPFTWNLEETGAVLGDGRGRITRVRFHTDQSTPTNLNVTLHVFTPDASNAAPTVENGDNGAFQATSVLYRLGEVALDLTTAAEAGATGLSGFAAVSPAMCFDLYTIPKQSRKLYGFLEANAAYDPDQDVITITLEIED